MTAANFTLALGCAVASGAAYGSNAPGAALAFALMSLVAALDGIAAAIRGVR